MGLSDTLWLSTAALGRVVAVWHREAIILAIWQLLSNMDLSYNRISCFYSTRVTIGALGQVFMLLVLSQIDLKDWLPIKKMYRQWCIVIIRRKECLCWRCWRITIGNNSFSGRTRRVSQRRYCLLSVTVVGWMKDATQPNLFGENKELVFVNGVYFSY